MRRIKETLVDGREVVRLIPETPADVITIRLAEKNGAKQANFSFGDLSIDEEPGRQDEGDQ